jgi:electron transfer flavoprotein beta subunit
MRVMATAKRVVDHSVKVYPKADGTDVDIAHARMEVNPFDEIAVEQAVRWKEAGLASETFVVTVGPAASEEAVRACYAVGIDRGILIRTERRAYPPDVARLLAKIAERERPDVIVMGKQAIDDDCNQTGQMLSALLGWRQATFCSEIAFKDGAVECGRETDEGLVRIRCALPVVLTCDLRLNVPRRPSLPAIMKARGKPVAQETPEGLGITLGAGPELLGVETPPKRPGGRKVKDVDELLRELKKRGVV